MVLSEERFVVVTHPFHPLSGQRFPLVEARRAGGEARVFFVDGGGVLRSLPAAWTDQGAPDPFVVVAAGRSALRFGDLVDLAAMVDAARPGSVKPIAPLL
ncbi:MAG: Y4bD/Y4pK family protein [Bifidobacteriaceae bacterium]|nr:Y4bD/Y4pK family protein [Bifidobacteriaceae bacterium]